MACATQERTVVVLKRVLTKSGLILALLIFQVLAVATAHTSTAKGPKLSKRGLKLSIPTLVDNEALVRQDRGYVERSQFKTEQRFTAKRSARAARQVDKKDEKKESAPVEQLPSTVNFRVLDALPREGRIKFSVRTKKGRERLQLNGLHYGQLYSKQSVMALSDWFEVDDGHEQFAENISSSASKVPDKGESFFIVDANEKGRLHAELTMFPNRTEHNWDVNDAWLFIYNAMFNLSPEKRGEKVDVVVYDWSRLLRGDPPLYRIAKNISLNQGFESSLPRGTYEVKVVGHDTVKEVCSFQNTLSITPPLNIRMNLDSSYFVILHGRRPDSYHFSPNILILPQHRSSPPKESNVDLFVLNAFKSYFPVNVFFPHRYHIISVHYGQSVHEEIQLRHGDCFHVFTKGQEHIRRSLDVPPLDSLCVVVPDTLIDNALDTFYHCWPKYTELAAPGVAWVFTYNALYHFNAHIDFMVLSDELGPVEGPFAIMENATTGQGVPSLVPAGKYHLKAVPTGTVRTMEDFLAAPSLITNDFIEFSSQIHHFVVLFGEIYPEQGKRGSIAMYPEMLINKTTAVLAETSQPICQNAPTPSPASQPSNSPIALLAVLGFLLTVATVM